MSKATASSLNSMEISSHLSLDKPVVLNRKILLVVDDDENISKALKRLLGRKFHEIVTAQNSGEAVLLLETRSVTHLVCDYWLGNGEPLGIDLVPAWRMKYPSIERAVIFTGNEINSIPVPFGVDEILSKSVESTPLINALGN
ncbi:MAG: hypothetical protein GY847_12360 [Proteobacteria bacterium]|nr:hypothetical protein [Pseudomonadota bacterium]